MVGILKGVRDIVDSVRARAGTPSGRNLIDLPTGGLRCASTSGYSLTTLRVALPKGEETFSGSIC
jgi:hypothetical protein